MIDFRALENIKGKETKPIIAPIIQLFQKLEESFSEMLSSFKDEFQKVMDESSKEIVDLKLKVKTLEKTVEKLEERIDDNDSYERRDTLIFSGKKIPTARNVENTAELVCQLVKDNLQITLAPSDISVAHRLNAQNNSQRPEKRSIIAKFCRRDLKNDILFSARKKKCPDLFVNECLTPCQQTISFVLRRAKREFPDLISGTTTFDGKNFVWVKPPNPSAPGAKDTRLKVSTHAKLLEFCTRTLSKPLAHYLTEWTH